MAATYGGNAIFGEAETIVHAVNPSAQQLNEFFGVSGRQSLWGGFRGRVFMANGVLFGSGTAGINAVEAAFASYAGDGVARVLIDARGRAWPSVLCESFSPDGRVKLDANSGMYFFAYKATFTGLV